MRQNGAVLSSTCIYTQSIWESVSSTPTNGQVYLTHLFMKLVSYMHWLMVGMKNIFSPISSPIKRIVTEILVVQTDTANSTVIFKNRGNNYLWTQQDRQMQRQHRFIYLCFLYTNVVRIYPTFLMKHFQMVNCHL